MEYVSRLRLISSGIVKKSEVLEVSQDRRKAAPVLSSGNFDMIGNPRIFVRHLQSPCSPAPRRVSFSWLSSSERIRRDAVRLSACSAILLGRGVAGPGVG